MILHAYMGWVPGQGEWSTAGGMGEGQDVVYILCWKNFLRKRAFLREKTRFFRLYLKIYIFHRFLLIFSLFFFNFWWSPEGVSNFFPGRRGGGECLDPHVPMYGLNIPGVQPSVAGHFGHQPNLLRPYGFLKPWGSKVYHQIILFLHFHILILIFLLNIYAFYMLQFQLQKWVNLFESLHFINTACDLCGQPQFGPLPWKCLNTAYYYYNILEIKFLSLIFRFSKDYSIFHWI